MKKIYLVGIMYDDFSEGNLSILYTTTDKRDAYENARKQVARYNRLQIGVAELEIGQEVEDAIYHYLIAQFQRSED